MTARLQSLPMARLQLALLLALAACALAQDNNNTFYEQSGISVTTEDAVLMQGVWAHTVTGGWSGGGCFTLRKTGLKGCCLAARLQP